MKKLMWIPSCIACLGAVTEASAAPLGPEFTYQGQLTQGGSPVNGPVVLRFSIWDAATAGSLASGFQTVGVQVTNGNFTATLDSDGAFATGEARWLEIAVCSDPGCSTPTTLSPRQPLTATPYAQYAQFPWLREGANHYVTFGTKIGIGTSNPNGPLDVRADGSTVWIDGAGDVHYDGGFDSHFGFYNDGAIAGSTAFLWGGVVRVLFKNNGQVGIGTTSPASLLDVRGDVRLGPNGDMFAPGGWENLRIIRGIINADGSAPVGCCFSVSHPVTGQYDITFNEAFSSTPVVVASSNALGGLINVVPLSNSSVRILVRNSTNTNAINGGFHFIATSER